MNEKKYHVSKNGFLTRCSAKKRSCPRQGQHYTQEQYNEMANNNDPRVRVTTAKHAPDSFYGQAEAKYSAAVRAEQNWSKVSSLTAKFEKKLKKEKGIRDYDMIAEQNKSEAVLDSALNYARTVYEEEGVNPIRANFIVSDMRLNQDPMRPVTKRKDKYDPDITAKTKAAAARLKKDPEYNKFAATYEELKTRRRTAESVHSEVNAYRYATMRELGCTGPIERHRAEAEQGLQKAKKWLGAGVSPSAKEQMTNSLKPEMVSVDNTGKINNVWVDTGDGVERVIGYKDNVVNPSNGSGSGALLTASGKQIYTVTHYHSYTSEQSGSPRVIVGAKNGDTHPSKHFTLNASFDTGD